MKNKSTFPIPKTYHENKGLKAPKEYYDTAKSNKIAALVLASVAGLTIGADVLHNGDVGPASFVASGVLGVASMRAFRENQLQNEALTEANAVVIPVERQQTKPTDINIRHI